MRTQRALRSAGLLMFPAVILLTACPQQDGPMSASVRPTPTTVSPTEAPADAPADAPAEPASDAPAPAPAPAAPADAQYFEDFSSESSVDGLQLEVFHRNLHFNPTGPEGPHIWGKTWSGDHDMNCGPPDTQRVVHQSGEPRLAAADTDPEAFWWCAPGDDPAKGHFMTSMGDIDGYSIVAFAPDEVFTNFSRVCWDVNLTRLGARKWPEVMIIPEEAFQANGRTLAYHLSEATPYPEGSFVWLQSDSVPRYWHNMPPPELENLDGETYLTNDKATRFHHCIVDNRDGTITFTQARDDRTVVATVPGSFPEQGRVILSDHSYSPEKDGPIQGFTWHWDNVEVG